MNVVFPAQAEYSYFSADFTLKIIAYDISVCVSRYIVHVLHCFSLQSAARSRCHVKKMPFAQK